MPRRTARAFAEKGWRLFRQKGFAALRASVIRHGRMIRRSLRAKYFSDVHAAGKRI